MKQLTEKETFTRENAYGRSIVSVEQRFEIETGDKEKSNYLGYGRPSKKFTNKDIGKTITVYEYEGYTSWCFDNIQGGKNG